MSGVGDLPQPVGAMAPVIQTFAFSAENENEVQRILRRYPAGRQASAVIPLLDLAQRQHGGWLPKAILDYVADYLGMPRIRVYEIATFYDMFYTVPVGRTKIQVCTTTPCWLQGSDDVVRACRDELGVDLGESTPDGTFFLREFECLGACCNAPILWVDDVYYEDVGYDAARDIIQALKRGETPAAGSVRGRHGSMPEGGKTTLFAVPHVVPTGQEADAPPDQAPIEKARPDHAVADHAVKVERDGRPGPEIDKPSDKGA